MINITGVEVGCSLEIPSLFPALSSEPSVVQVVGCTEFEGCNLYDAYLYWGNKMVNYIHFEVEL